MAVVCEIIDLLVCRKNHGCGCVADDPVPRKRHTLEVNEINLAMDTEPFGVNILDSSHRLPPLQHPNTLRAAIGEHLAELSGYIIVCLLGSLSWARAREREGA